MIGAMVVAMQVDKGLLSYEDPNAKHWPEFAQVCSCSRSFELIPRFWCAERQR